MAYGSINNSSEPSALQNNALSSHSTNSNNEFETNTHSRWHQSLHEFYTRNLGLLLVFLAQTCGSVMNTAAKLLANDPSIKFHALQIIFIRMTCTTVLGMAYMWWNGIGVLGPQGKRIRGLLVVRGLSGFVGIFGLYCKFETS